MTTLDLSPHIGTLATWHINGLSISVTIRDCKRSYGRTRYLIAPVAGQGEVWVQDNLTHTTKG